MPYFSIVIPMYNRRRFIARALDSCLSQDFTDFEAIVVDDGSTDGSAEVVQGYTDARIKLIRHEVNRGRCPSRNTGMQAADGEWFVFLDSDDGLLPGALRRIYDRAQGLGREFGALRFMCQDETGQLSPYPPLREETWDYEGYIRWVNSTCGGRSETLPCTRQSTFPEVQYPTDHAEEGLYHLDIARRFRVLSCPDIVRMYYQDADNQVTRPSPQRALQYAPAAANNVERVLERHGDALKEWAVLAYWDLIRVGACSNFLAGNRAKALQYSALYLRHRPLSLKTWAITVLGIFGPAPLAWMQAERSQRRLRRRIAG